MEFGDTRNVKKRTWKHATNLAFGALNGPPISARERRTQCLHSAVGHAFTAQYTRRFKREFEPLDVICECGYEERTLAYIIFDCPLFLKAHNEIDIDNRCSRPSIIDLFGTIDGAKQLFKFLNNSPAVHKSAKSPWLPEVPRLDLSTDSWYWYDSTT